MFKLSLPHLKFGLFLLMSLGLLSSIACSKSNVDVEELFAEVPINVDGNPDGKVTLVEFLDYRCSDCREMVPTITQLIDKNANLRIVYRFYPVLGPLSEYVERVALAAQLQGRFLALHHLLVNAKQPLTKEVVLELAKQAAIDLTQLELDMNSPQVETAFQHQQALVKAWQITGTPTFFIGKTTATGRPIRVNGGIPAADLQQLINQSSQ